MSTEAQINTDIDEQPPTIAAKPRNAFIAFLFSLLLPGLGQVYNGQPKKAVLFFGLLLLSPVLFGLFRGTTSFYGLVTLVAIELVLRIVIIVDGVRNAIRQKEYVLKTYNTWYHHLLIAAGMFTVLMTFNVTKILGTRAFVIPTTSNNPTLQVDDRVVADLKAYDNSQPDYGDFVLFTRSDGQFYTFRVVGKPNDKLDIIDNVVSVNGQPARAKFVKETTNDGVPVAEFEEELPNGHRHFIYKFKRPYDITKTTIRNLVVPPDSYFLIGDNRDNALDSRYKGFVRTSSIQGRVIYSYWGETGIARMNVDFRDK